MGGGSSRLTFNTGVGGETTEVGTSLEFKVKLVYRMSSKTTRATQRNHVSENNNKKHEHKQLGEKRVSFSLQLQLLGHSITEELQGTNSKQELGGRN